MIRPLLNHLRINRHLLRHIARLRDQMRQQDKTIAVLTERLRLAQNRLGEELQKNADLTCASYENTRRN